MNYTEALDWETEVNNKYEKANDLPINAEKNGTLVESDDCDWYKFEIESDGYITIDFTHEVLASKASSWYMDLYMSDATTGYGRNEGRTYWDIVGNENLTTPKLGIKAGTYYIRISSPPSYLGDWDDADYSIKVNFVGNVKWEIENNNSQNKATSISADENCGGSTQNSDDVDWYVVHTGEAYRNLALIFAHGFTSTDDTCWKITIYGQDGTTKLGSVDIKGNQLTTYYEFYSSDSTIYVKVSKGSYNLWQGGYNTSSTEYSLVVMS